MVQHILTCILWVALTHAYKKIPMFVGIDPDSSYGFEIRMYPDMISDFTIVSVNDFSCNQRNLCLIDDNKKVMTLMGITVIYYDAATQLNLIKQPFAAPFNFRYIANDTNNIGSWLGVSSNSTYLKYLYQQDVVSGYRIIFRLGWDNELIYKQGVFEGDKILFMAVYPATITINNGNAIEVKKINFCLNNKLDMVTPGLSMIGVPSSSYSYWTGLLQNWSVPPNRQQATYFLNFSLSDNNGNNLGNAIANFQDFTINDTFRIKSFAPEFDVLNVCDIYTGSLFLKQFDFKFYYIEYDAGFDVRFSMTDFQLPPDPPVSVTWKIILKVILVIIIISIVALIIWHNSCRHRPAENEPMLMGNQVQEELMAPTPLFEMKKLN